MLLRGCEKKYSVKKPKNNPKTNYFHILKRVDPHLSMLSGRPKGPKSHNKKILEVAECI